MRPEDQVGWGASILDLKLIEGSDAAIAGETEEVTGMVVVDDETLEFHLKKADPTFPLRMATWMQGIFKAEMAEQDPDFFLNPIGVGPYKASVVPNESIEMTATENWWETPPIIQRVSGQDIREPQTQLLMFENEELDVMQATIGRFPALYLGTHPLNKYLVNMPYPGFGAFGRLNTARPPLNDIQIRKALAHAIDMGSIVEAVYGKREFWNPSVLQPALQCWDPNNSPGHKFDPELAKRELALSRYKTGENVPLIQALTTPQNIPWTLIFQAWQAAWKEHLGIDFKIHIIERGQEVPEGINIIADSYGAYVPDPGFFLDLIVHTKTSGTLHVNDALDAKLDAANALRLDDPGRCAAFQEVDREFMEGYYILPVKSVHYSFLVQPWVIGLETSVNNDIGTLPFLKIGKRTR